MTPRLPPLLRLLLLLQPPSREREKTRERGRNNNNKYLSLLSIPLPPTGPASLGSTSGPHPLAAFLRRLLRFLVIVIGPVWILNQGAPL